MTATIRFPLESLPSDQAKAFSSRLVYRGVAHDGRVTGRVGLGEAELTYRGVPHTRRQTARSASSVLELSYRGVRYSVTI